MKDEEKVSYQEIIYLLVEIPEKDYKHLMKAVKQIRKGNKLIDDAYKRAEETILVDETIEEMENEQNK